jgi:acyl dehydratase
MIPAIARPGQELRSRERIITREDIVAYAEASGDRNPLHLDDAFAREAGFDGVIAHGMLTLGHLASAIVGWCGSPENVLSLSAQFRSPVRPGDTIVAHGRVRSVEPAEGTATLDVWVSVERNGAVNEPVRRGTARVRL